MLKIIEITEADFGCEERPEGAPLMCRLVIESDDGLLYKEIPDRFADELGLVEGLQISENELKDILAGNVPKDWESIDNRSDYETNIGLVCMANREYREYKTKRLN